MKKEIRQRPRNLEFEQSLTCHPVLARIFAGRPLASAEELENDLQGLLPFHSLLSIDRAVERLYQALLKQERIVIIGDFDADGATSTAIGVRALRILGFTQVDYLVPNRFEYGYGLSPEIVDLAKQSQPDLLITVDNGIVNFEGAARAQELGMDLIITDHHLGAERLPRACAVVNPNQSGDAFPSKNLAGCGVIFYVMLALRAYLKEKNYFEINNLPPPNLGKLLDIVALGTVADLVSLDHNNRILVHHGLKRIREGQACPGILALLKVAKRDFAKVTASDLGFAVGPRLNAAGRLEDMSLGIECLLTEDARIAEEYARRLNQLNTDRREIEQTMRQQAMEAVKLLPLDENKLPKAICLFHPDWHQGIVGLVASRIKDQAHRPTIVFARGDAGELKGSARSIAGVHIRDVLASVAAAHPGLIIRFGGHAMAAGLTIAQDQLAAFQGAFQEQVEALLQGVDLSHEILTDGPLEAEDLTLATAQLLKEAGPFGQNFAEPLFHDVFRIVDQRLVGGQHLKLLLAKEDLVLEAMHFFVNPEVWPNHRAEQAQVAYRLDINEYQGRRSLQLLVEHLEIL